MDTKKNKRKDGKEPKLIFLHADIIKLLDTQSKEVKAKSLKAYMEQVLSMQAINKPKK